MKSQKGVTMVTLVIYVSSFVLITGIVGAITTYFYNNMKLMDVNISSNAEYNKLNLYMANKTHKDGVQILKYGEDYITFLELDGSKNTFVRKGDILYYNTYKLCGNVEDFKVSVDDSTAKTVLSVLFKVSGTSYTTKYVIEAK